MDNRETEEILERFTQSTKVGLFRAYRSQYGWNVRFPNGKRIKSSSNALSPNKTGQRQPLSTSYDRMAYLDVKIHESGHCILEAPVYKERLVVDEHISDPLKFGGMSLYGPQGNRLAINQKDITVFKGGYSLTRGIYADHVNNYSDPDIWTLRAPDGEEIMYNIKSAKSIGDTEGLFSFVGQCEERFKLDVTPNGVEKQFKDIFNCLDNARKTGRDISKKEAEALEFKGRILKKMVEAYRIRFDEANAPSTPVASRLIIELYGRNVKKR